MAQLPAPPSPSSAPRPFPPPPPPPASLLLRPLRSVAVRAFGRDSGAPTEARKTDDARMEPKYYPRLDPVTGDKHCAFDGEYPVAYLDHADEYLFDAEEACCEIWTEACEDDEGEGAAEGNADGAGDGDDAGGADDATGPGDGGDGDGGGTVDPSDERPVRWHPLVDLADRTVECVEGADYPDYMLDRDDHLFGTEAECVARWVQVSDQDGLPSLFFTGSGVVGGEAFLDGNDDGAKDAYTYDDLSAAENDATVGVAVSLHACTVDSDGGETAANARPLARVETFSGGFYRFSDLPPGNYYISVEPPEGYDFSGTWNRGEEEGDAGDEGGTAPSAVASRSSGAEGGLRARVRGLATGGTMNTSGLSTVNPATGRTICFKLEDEERTMEWSFGLHRPSEVPSAGPSATGAPSHGPWPSSAPSAATSALPSSSPSREIVDAGATTDAGSGASDLNSPSPMPSMRNPAHASLVSTDADQSDRAPPGGDESDRSSISSGETTRWKTVGIACAASLAALVAALALYAASRRRGRRRKRRRDGGRRDDSVRSGAGESDFGEFDEDGPVIYIRKRSERSLGEESSVTNPFEPRSVTSTPWDNATQEPEKYPEVEVALDDSAEDSEGPPTGGVILDETTASPPIFESRDGSHTKSLQGPPDPPGSPNPPLLRQLTAPASLTTATTASCNSHRDGTSQSGSSKKEEHVVSPASSRLAREASKLEQDLEALSVAIESLPPNSPSWLLLHSHIQWTQEELEAVRKDRCAAPASLTTATTASSSHSNRDGASQSSRRMSRQSSSTNEDAHDLPPASSRVAAEAQRENLSKLEKELETLSVAIESLPKNSPSWLFLRSRMERAGEELEAVREDLSLSPPTIHVVAPPGNLGLIVDRPPPGGGSCVYVRVLDEASPLRDQLRLDDEIVAIDDEDVREMSPVEVGRMLSSKIANEKRKISVVRRK
ncbi:hypothetical protein ACHAWF_007250 [Thalassiosira exigua]